MTKLPDGYYEVEKTKKKINLDLPIHIGVFILNYAKLRMLKLYYNCVDKYLSVRTFSTVRWILTWRIWQSLETVLKN